RLNVSQEDRVVDMPEGVEVTEADALSVDEHRRDANGGGGPPRPSAEGQRARGQTECAAGQSPAIAQLLLSTRPASRPVRWTASKSRSVSILELFLGHATQSPSAGSSVSRRRPTRCSRAPR